MKNCINCGAESYRTESRFCSKCGASLPSGEVTPLQNFCTNADCDWNKTKFIYPDGANFCDVCGSPTVHAKQSA